MFSTTIRDVAGKVGVVFRSCAQPPAPPRGSAYSASPRLQRQRLPHHILGLDHVRDFI
jgi:hypothetical protein